MTEAERLMRAGEVDAIVRVPQDFSRRLAAGDARMQLLLNGVDSTTAQTVEGYVNSAIATWAQKQVDRAGNKPPALGRVEVVQRMWFNETGNSSWYLVPGLIVLVLTLIGAFLTSLLIAREWERGTLESLFVTPVRPLELIFAKLAPYLVVGAIDLVLCLLAARFLFEVPLRGSLPILCLASMLYLLVSLLLGLFISGKTRNQFEASQLAMLVSFMPAMMLSGFVFDLRNVPLVIQVVSAATAGHAFHGADQNAVPGGRPWADHPAQRRHPFPLRRGAGVRHTAHAAQVTGLTAMASFIVTFTQIIALVRKELLALIKEPASRALLIAPAFLQALLYGYGATYDLTHVPYAVLDQSRSAASTELLARIDGTGVFVRAATLTSPRQIAEMVDAEKALLVLSIPPDFAARLGSGQPAPLQLILDGRNSSTAGSAASHVGAIVAAYNASLGTGAPGIRVERRAWFNPNLESRWNMMPGTDCRAEPDPDPAAGGAVGRPRTRAGHLRPVAGDAAHARCRSWSARPLPSDPRSDVAASPPSSS
jgi:ABC-type multidrug transport system permease subunit